jgi:hypothetical protein
MAKSKLKGDPAEIAFLGKLLGAPGSSPAERQNTEKLLYEMLENIKNSVPRTEPSVIPMVNGKPVTIEEYRLALLDRYRKGTAFYTELSLKLAPKSTKDPNAVPWKDISGLHTDLAGGKDSESEDNEGLYYRMLNEKSAKQVIKHSDPNFSINKYPTQEALLEYVKTYASINIAQQGISSTTKVKLLIEIEGKKNILLVTKVSPIYDGANVTQVQNDPKKLQWGDRITPYFEPGEALIAPLDIEHFKSLATEKAENLLRFFIKLDINLKANKVTIENNYSPELYNKTVAFLDSLITETRNEIEQMKKIDNIFVDPTISSGMLTKEIADDLLRQVQKGPNGEYGFYMVAETHPNSNKFHLLPITIAFPDGFASGGAYGNRFWGQRAGVHLNRIVSKFLPSFKDGVGSYSLLSINTLNALSNIFAFNPEISAAFKKAIKKNFPKPHSSKIFIPVFKAKNFKVKKFKNFLVPKPRKKSRSSKQQAFLPSQEQATENIVPILNAEIKRYVLEQMSYPSLENRSGRFASSVRVLSAQENAAVQYTYQKSPYQVFSQTRGKPAWNDRQERDPAQIIDKAIKKIGMDKFGKVFRTEER